MGDAVQHLARTSDGTTRPMHFRNVTENKLATNVPISILVLERTVRTRGEDGEHVRMLAELDAALPPITVHRESMRVIDGMHRVRAALLRGESHIDAVFFDGDERDAFVLAVGLNTEHGLPLSRTDRIAAASRIVASHPELSDRSIASVAGIAAKTVHLVRTRSTGELPQPHRRRGQDGKMRPLSTAIGRELAGRLLQNRPNASLREIAREAGISVGTVRDVRRRLLGGEELVPTQQRDSADCARGDLAKAIPETNYSDTDAHAPAMVFPESVRSLTRDPSLRLSENGRKILRLLDAHATMRAEWDELVQSVPMHASCIVAEMADVCAESWVTFAKAVRQRRATDQDS